MSAHRVFQAHYITVIGQKGVSDRCVFREISAEPQRIIADGSETEVNAMAHAVHQCLAQHGWSCRNAKVGS